MSVTVKVTGIDEVVRMLDKLRDDLRGEAVQLALMAGALNIVNDAKRRAPYRTGNLRRSIHVGGFGSQGGLEGGTDGTDIGGRETHRILVGTNVVYAARIEFGFADTDSLGRRYNQAAQPYLRPAMEAQKDAAVRDVARALEQIVRAAA